MSKKKHCSSSSSDSEEDLKLKECVALFEAEKKVSVATTALKSKRFIEEADPEEENFVSAEFQTFVGKKLSAKLDE